MKFMSRTLDISGQVFGRLTVLRFVEVVKRSARWECLCLCGNKCIVPCANLRNGNTKSCGCLQKDRVSEATRLDLTGQKFNRLTVVEKVGIDRYRSYLWRCKCDCGNEIVVVGRHIKSGHTKSCGCFQKEQASIAYTGKPRTEETKRKISIAKVGKQLSEEHKRKLSIAHIGIQAGSNSPSWKGGITPVYFAVRNSLAMKQWRNQVFTRDNYTCQVCNQNKSGNLCVHHKVFFNHIIWQYNITNLEEAEKCTDLWNVENGITLCKDCHKQYHKINGMKYKEAV